MTIIEQYEKGLVKIAEEDYSTAYSIFLKIKNHKQAPSNTNLYLLWAQIKREDVDICKNRSEAVKIQKAINSCPISLRTTSLFWYVKGIFCLKTKQYEKAKELFTKTLLVQKDFAPAKKELIIVKQQLKKQNKSSGKVFLVCLKNPVSPVKRFLLNKIPFFYGMKEVVKNKYCSCCQQEDPIEKIIVSGSGFFSL